MKDYIEYGYKDDAPPESSSYLKNSILSLLSKDNNKTILDIGCGNGWLCESINKEGYTSYGIDASPQGISIAQKRISNRFYVQDITSTHLPEAIQNINFDTIISTEVMEHLYNPAAYLQFCKTILLKNGGGELIISVPYHGYLKNVALALTGSMDKHFTVNRVGGHIKFFSRKTMCALLNQNGFKVNIFKGSGRLPYLWKSMVIKAEIRN